MNCSVVIQTCDKYEPFWEGFFHFMDKHWSKSIPCPIYFCNERKDLNLPTKFNQIKTGEGSFVQNLNCILDVVKEENIFYMLEDFWPFAPMRSSMFEELYKVFSNQNADALQVGTYTPYYELERTDLEACGKKLLKFKPESEWIFNFQARFWRKARMRDCLVEPEISEKAVGSAITVEMASDKFAREKLNLNVLLYQYFWYPISGVAYRGRLNEAGEQMQNIVNIEKFVIEKFSTQVS